MNRGAFFGPLLLSVARLVAAQCRNLECYNDAVCLAESEANLLAECTHGIFSHKTVTQKGFCGDDCPARTCNSNSHMIQGQLYVQPHQYKQICDCVKDTSIPTHCRSIPCYYELLALAGNDPAEFRYNCARPPMPMTDVWKGAVPDSTGCGVHHPDGLLLQISEAEHDAVCQCVLRQYLQHRPATFQYYPLQSQEPINVDVFVHLVIRSLDTVYLYNWPGAIEAIFKKKMAMFDGSKVRLTIKLVQIVVNRVWAAGGDNAGMRQTLHLGDIRDLNFYIVEQLDSDPEKTRPIDPQRKVFCTPPTYSDKWHEETTGADHQDGCIVSLDSDEAHAVAITQEMKRWIGVCDYVGRECPSDLAEADMKAILIKLATMRFVPLPRVTKDPVSYIMTQRKQNSLCENLQCYRELDEYFGGVGILTVYCQYYDMTGWGYHSHMEGLILKEANFDYVPGRSCGAYKEGHWQLPFSELRPLCHCIMGSSIAPHWSYTYETLSGATNNGSIYIDVFIHAIASSGSSPMAMKYFNKTEIDSHFLQTAAFYNDTRIVFRVKSVELIVNHVWASGNDSTTMRQTLYMGGSRDLNLYYLEAPTLERAVHLNQPIKSFCTSPFSSWWAYLTLNDPEHDGCLIAFGSTPGNLATVLQFWMGTTTPLARACKYVDPGCPLRLKTGLTWTDSSLSCEPKFDYIDKSIMYAQLALSRFVPTRSKWSRLRLFGAKGY